jgi:hypothetical protein
VGDFGDAYAGVVVVEEHFGGFFEHCGGQGRGAGAEVVDVSSCGHYRELVYLVYVVVV